MIDFDPVDSYSRLDLAQSPPPKRGKEPWEKVGQAVLYGSLFLGAAAYLPVAFSKKKRMITSASPPPDPASAPQAAQAEPEEVLESEDPSPEEAVARYHRLPCTETDRATIREIIDATNEKSYRELINLKGELEKKGKEIEHIHPYKFLAAIFTNPRTKKNIDAVFQSRFTYFETSNILGGIQRGMEREKDTLDEYLLPFAAEVKADSNVIRPMIQSGSWNKLVLHLCEISR